MDCDCKVCAGRVEAEQAETQARYANLYGSWAAFDDSKPARRWVRGDGGWSSYDPVIVRARERVAARKAKEEAKAKRKAERAALAA